MSISINTNITSLMATRGLQSTTNNLATSMQRLATGLRINSAKDDAGGLAVSTRLTSQIRGANQAIQNVNAGAALVDVAMDALNEVVNTIQDIRDIAVAAVSITNVNELTALNTTVGELKTTINNIFANTKYNNLGLFDGTFNNETFQTGPNSGDTTTVDITGTLQTYTTLGMTDTVSSSANAALLLTAIDGTALPAVNTFLATLSATSSRFEAIANTLSSSVSGMTASRSAIMDADVAVESANMTKNAIIQQAGVAVLAQANLQPQLFLKLFD
ncbi:MAG: flagellin FliC [Magnetococcus sp. YQC-9]